MADNVAIVKGVYEALAKEDINTVLGALDEQVEWHLPNTTRYGRARHSWGRRPSSRVSSRDSLKSTMVSGSTSNGSLGLATRCWLRCGIEARGR